jgi:hypothetical protein
MDSVRIPMTADLRDSPELEQELLLLALLLDAASTSASRIEAAPLKTDNLLNSFEMGYRPVLFSPAGSHRVL